MASSALAWSAIDSLGVESTQLELVAKACALHSIRQQLIGLYQTVTDSALNHLRSAQMRLSHDRRALARLERAMRRTQGHDQPAARAAHTLLNERARQALWRARLADPKLLAGWLPDQQDVLHALLEWLYATRNSAIHRGQFTAPADAMTAHAARGVVDMLLEFLGNWHKIQYSQGVAEADAVDVIGELADRKDALTDHLNQAPSCHPLNLDSVTGPDVDCWNRP